MLEDLIASPLFRSLAPVVAGLAFTLAGRYVSAPTAFDRHDWSLAVPMMGASVTAMPALIALHAEQDGSSDDVFLGAFLLFMLTVVGFFLVVLDRHLLEPLRNSGGTAGVLAGIVVPNAFGALCLAAVFAYAP